MVDGLHHALISREELWAQTDERLDEYGRRVPDPLRGIDAEQAIAESWGTSERARAGRAAAEQMVKRGG